MANIKPAEISQILKQQLEGFKTQAELEEVGTVLQVGDGIALRIGRSPGRHRDAAPPDTTKEKN